MSALKLPKLAFCLLGLLSPFFWSCYSTSPTDQTHDNFKIIGYFSAGKIDTAAIPYEQLTHINYAFAIPNKAGDGGLLPVPKPDTLRSIVRNAHKNNVKVFISVGGWNIGDGGGIDDRFEKLGNHRASRTKFTQSILEVIKDFNLDGADIDWEYPDPILPSSDNYVKLMTELRDSLHKRDKQLTAAVVSYHDKHGYGIQKEIFDIVDWLNLMAYDDDYNTFDGKHVPHAPFWLVERSFDYWVEDRGLPEDKAVMGVPFYGKGDGQGASYNQLIEMGADPYADAFDGIYYNGIRTMKEKTKLALKRGSGIMIWEIPLDTLGEYSLLRSINAVVDKES